jgi:hypothetical protein
LISFREYTVLGMFVVNFLGHYPAHYNCHHNDYFLSYADTIMPAFLFVVGISFRFSLLRRLAAATFVTTYAGYFRRSLALCLISIILNGIGQNFDDYKVFFVNPQTDELAQADWEQFEQGNADRNIPQYFGDRVWLWARLFAKSYVWETLAVIGLAQLLVLPFVHLRFWYRVMVMIAMGLGHVMLTMWFNWQFFYGYTIDGQYIELQAGLNNWMGQLLGTGANRSWDGGIIGLLTWSFTMLAGTLCYDLMSDSFPWQRVMNLLRWGVTFMVIGYGMSCLQTFYDLSLNDEPVERSIPAAANERITNTRGKDKGGFPFQLAASPVVPDWSVVKGRPVSSFLTELPFTARPENRLISYWMMSKRFASLSYVTAASGLSFIGLALFVMTADILRWQSSVLRTFGMNALAAYVLHKMVLNGLMYPVIPHNAAAWMYWSGLFVYMMIVYGLVRGLEKQGVFIRMWNLNQGTHVPPLAGIFYSAGGTCFAGIDGGFFASSAVGCYRL